MKRSKSSTGSGMGLSSSRNSLETLALRQIAEVEERLLADLTEVLNEIAPSAEEVQEHLAMLQYVAQLCSTLWVDNDFSGKAWTPCVVPYLTCFLPAEESAAACESFRYKEEKRSEAERMLKLGLDPEEDMGPEICNIYFSLAYGGKVLLHNTHLFLHRGKKYGLLGHNGAGKTTLLRNIANGKIEGMPPNLVSVFVESHFDEDEEQEISVKDYIIKDPALAGKDPAKIDELMRGSLGFDDVKLNGPTSALSGGWRMKLALARCILIEPDIMLLDEPTNHLDHATVDWFIKRLQNETHATVLVVSHDTGFLDAVCTDIIHYENQKLVRYPGNLSQFVEKKPECKSYYELASTGGLVFKFPNPGRLEGINSTTRKICFLENVDFKYPAAEKNQLTGVTCQLCLGSRVVVLGPNGAGKTTLINLLVGEKNPTNTPVKEGGAPFEVWKHHNLRISYVAQHSFHHVEAHLDKSPVEYIQWRFKGAQDQESLAKESMQIDQEAADKLGQKYGQIEKLTGARHMKSGKLEYEVHFQGMRDKDNKYLTRDELEIMGFGPLCRAIDEKVAAEAAGIDLRTCTTSEVQAHLDDFNLAQEFGTYGRIKGLSGGQKVKLVLAAAFWTCPHLLVLDEPTNYLDREALGALAEAIKNFGGGVIMISHNREFYGALCNEEWSVSDGILTTRGQAAEADLKLTRKKTEKDKLMEATESIVEESQEVGNTNAVRELQTLINEKTGRPLSKKEIRDLAKKQKKADKDKAKGKK